MAWWNPEIFARKVPFLEERARVFRDVRQFFDARGYLEVETPALQAAPCMEAHLKAFKTEIVSPDGEKRAPLYLHTSPEFAMKKLLVAGLPRIYQLAKVYRNAEGSRWHSPEFTMLEWYQAGMGYREMMAETAELIRHVCSISPSPALREREGAHARHGKGEGLVTREDESCVAKPSPSRPLAGPPPLPQAGEGILLRANGKTCDPALPWEEITVVDALEKYAGVDISGHLNDLAHLRAEARRIGVYVSDADDWDNALLKILMDKVEPHLGAPAPTVLYDYPVSMAALARAKPEDPRFAERFEVYACGVELANGFGELTDAKIQRERFAHEVTLRRKTYGEDYPVDEDFLAALEHGLPFSSGNALGLDRLVMLACGTGHIDDVQAAPVTY